MSEPDSKVIRAVESKVDGRNAARIAGALATVCGVLVLAAWNDMRLGRQADRDEARAALFKLENMIDTRANLIDAQRRLDIDRLERRMQSFEDWTRNHEAEVRPLREKLVTAEETARRAERQIEQLATITQRIATDVATIKVQVGGGGRRDRDRVDERPAPPPNVERIPMLWHF